MRTENDPDKKKGWISAYIQIVLPEARYNKRTILKFHLTELWEKLDSSPSLSDATVNPSVTLCLRILKWAWWIYMIQLLSGFFPTAMWYARIGRDTGWANRKQVTFETLPFQNFDVFLAYDNHNLRSHWLRNEGHQTNSSRDKILIPLTCQKPS